MAGVLGNPESTAIIAVVDAEVAAARLGDYVGYAALLSEDATFMPPGGHARRGKDLHTWLRVFLERFRVEWLSFEHGDVVAEGDLGYHTYNYSWRVTPKEGGSGLVSHGKGIHILRRQSDGKWRIVHEIWNTSPERDE